MKYLLHRYVTSGTWEIMGWSLVGLLSLKEAEIDSWGSLVSQFSLVIKHEASERTCLKNKVYGTQGIIASADLQL